MNNSVYDIRNVTVNSNGNANKYIFVRAKQYSDYKKYASAYSYGYISLFIKGRKLVIQPKDYVGEQLLPRGKYTYKISIDSKKSLNMVLVKD